MATLTEAVEAATEAGAAVEPEAEAEWRRRLAILGDEASTVKCAILMLDEANESYLPPIWRQMTATEATRFFAHYALMAAEHVDAMANEAARQVAARLTEEAQRAPKPRSRKSRGV